MPAELVTIKILIAGVLLVGSLTLVANMVNGSGRWRGKRALNREPGIRSKVSEPTAVGENGITVLHQEETDPSTPCRSFDHQEPGAFNCACCGNHVFSSAAKFSSENGWSGFLQPAHSESVTELTEITSGLVRTEIICKKCAAHLGHVAGHRSILTGKHYIINLNSLDYFKTEGLA